MNRMLPTGTESLVDRLRTLVTYEHGAVLWVPALLAVAYLVLFGLNQAGSTQYAFDHSKDLRVVLGPWTSTKSAAAAQPIVIDALRQRLLERHEILPIDPPSHKPLLTAQLGQGTRQVVRPWQVMTGGLKIRYSLTGRLEHGGDDRLKGQMQIWEASKQLPTHVVNVFGEALSMGQALADSLQAFVFSQSTILHGSNPTAEEIGSR